MPPGEGGTVTRYVTLRADLIEFNT